MFHRRMYFIIPNEPQAVQVVADLEAAGVDRRHIHAIAGKGTTLTQLPAATQRQRDDAVWRLERIVWVGNLVLFFLALIGLCGSIFLDSLPGAVSSLCLMALFFFAGALFALRVPDTHLNEFHGALSHREVLLMVDVPRQRVAEIEERVHRRHPEATPGSTGWIIEALGI